MQFFLATCLATLKKQSIASYKRHVTYCNLGPQLAMVSNTTLESRTATLCNRCKKKKRALQPVIHGTFIYGVVRQVVGGLQHATCPLCNFSCNVSGLPTIAQSIELGSAFCNDFMNFVFASCSLRL